MALRAGGNGQPPRSSGAFRAGRLDDAYRRIIVWSLVAVGIIVLFVLLNLAKNIYTEWLWFDEVGYRAVYTKGLLTRTWLFFAGAAFSAAVFVGNVLLALRLARRDEPAILPPETIVLIRGLTTIGVVAFSIIFAISMGAVASAQWENLLQFVNAAPFVNSEGVPIADPLNGHNPSFYVFSLPLLRFVQTWLLGLTVLAILGTIAIYAVGYSLRGFNWTFSRAVKLHVAALFATLALLVAWSYWFDAKELVFASRGLKGTLFGASYADATAKLFGLRFMMGVSVLVGVAAVVSAFRRGIALPVGAFGVWIVAVIGVLVLYPAGVQRLQVQPSELALETPYIARHLEMTREAYGLDQIQVSHFSTSEELPPENLVNNRAIVDNIRLWDHRPLRDTLNQIQFFRPYYAFLDVDVDRYEIGGETRQVMLSARELVPEALPDTAQSWVARRLQYTHGYGLAMSPVTEFTAEGRPRFFVKDVPPKGDIPVERPEIYYGENTAHYVVVNTRTEEFDYPTEQDVPVFVRYAGTGGIRLDSFLKKAAFAWRLAAMNILISNEITPTSRVMFNRNIQDRVSHIAPFLKLDADPYLVVADGKLWWIQDAYTTTSRFPYSQPFQADINYIRNSVKVVVDAYNGGVDFYVVDPDDAIARTYGNIFPSLFKPVGEMPPEIRKHIRYPESLFNVQEEMFRTYHVTDPRVFFTKEDVWSRPSEVFYNKSQQMESYYVIMPLPGRVEPEFLLLVPFTPLNRPNLVAWLAARSDGENYGKLVAFTFPKDKQVDGPSQVEARINNDPLISQQFTLWGQQGSEIIRGNLLVIPIGNSLLYVEPVYLQASTLKFPELKRVIVAIGANSPAMEPTLAQALDVALGRRAPSPPLGGLTPSTAGPSAAQPPPGATPTPVGPPTDLDQVIAELERLLQQLKELRRQQR